MVRIPFYARSQGNSDGDLVGYVLWDGKELKAEPDDSFALQNVLHSPACGDWDKVVLPDQDPEQWVRFLKKTYHGSYFWAGDVEEV